MPATMSGAEARALAVAAQGLRTPRPRSTATARRVTATIDSLGALQIDAINVVERTQWIVLFSRLGAHKQSLLFDVCRPGGPVWEYWGHAASLLPIDTHPLLRWRMEHGGTYVAGPTVAARMRAWYDAHASYINTVLAEVAEHGPLTAGQLRDPRRRQGEWWDRRSVGRQALEWLFGTGQLAAWRLPNFERVYDIPERVIAAEVLAAPTPPTDVAQRALLMRSARALGVATASDLASYFMIQPRVARARVQELLDDGSLVTVAVDGWEESGYVAVDVTRPRGARRSHATVLSPFDSLIWNRARTRRVFGFDFTIEVYVPSPKRVYGYYVLPLLVGDELVGRLDVKADRATSTLRVNGAFIEAPAEPRAATIAEVTAPELDAMRAWLQLEHIAIARRGNLATALQSVVAIAT